MTATLMWLTAFHGTLNDIEDLYLFMGICGSQISW